MPMQPRSKKVSKSIALGRGIDETGHNLVDAGNEEIVDTDKNVGANVCHEWTLATPEFQPGVSQWPAFTAEPGLLFDYSWFTYHDCVIFLKF